MKPFAMNESIDYTQGCVNCEDVFTTKDTKNTKFGICLSETFVSFVVNKTNWTWHIIHTKT